MVWARARHPTWRQGVYQRIRKCTPARAVQSPPGTSRVHSRGRAGPRQSLRGHPRPPWSPLAPAKPSRPPSNVFPTLIKNEKEVTAGLQVHPAHPSQAHSLLADPGSPGQETPGHMGTGRRGHLCSPFGSTQSRSP